MPEFLLEYATSPPSLVAPLVKNLPAMLETWVQSLGWEDPLEKEKATHSSILAWSYLHTKFKNVCSSSVKNTHCVLIGIVFNLYFALHNMVIFTILILPIQEHGISSHLFVWSSISFISVL